MSYSKTSLIDIIRQHALRFGDFTLASGKKGTYYLDCRQVTLHPEGIQQISAGLLEEICKQYSASMPECVGGMAIGADPITAGVVMLAGQQGLPTRGFMVRKEAKQHGMGRLVEGPVSPGMKCVIVEDVVTSGGSAIQAVAAVRAFGLEVLGVMAVVDRLEGGRKAFEAAGLELTTLLTIEDFGIKANPLG
jgi:orotate phosphoribosyltransferase